MISGAIMTKQNSFLTGNSVGKSYLPTIRNSEQGAVDGLQYWAGLIDIQIMGMVESQGRENALLLVALLHEQLVGDQTSQEISYELSEKVARSKSSDFQSYLYRDTLTGFYKKSFFKSEYQHRYRLGINAMMLINCDHLDEITESLGGVVKDTLLATISGLIRDSIRTVDFPCRWNDSEFVVLLPRTEMNNAKIVAERILSRSLCQDLRGSTLSIGLAVTENNEDFDCVFGRADWAVYSAQVSEKDKVVLG